MRTFSFCIMNNLEIIEEFECKFEHNFELRSILVNLWNKYTKNNNILGRYFFDKHSMEKDIDFIERQLKINEFCVFNKFEKYYVYAFSIDYTRFYVWSKNMQPKVISWTGDYESQTGKFVNIVSYLSPS